LLGAFGALVASAVLEMQYGSGFRDSIAFLIDPLLVAALIPMLIAQRERVAVRWLDAAPVRYVGRISYSIYLYQQLLTEPVMKRLHGIPMIVRILLTCAAVIMAASFSYYAVEQPFLRLKNRKSRSRAAEQRLQTAQA
jgi:peptidoglycan/LPS O-acetylase OafA/YrhL